MSKRQVYETGISPYVSETFHKVYCREEDGGLDEGKQVECEDEQRPECADRQRPEGENGRQVEREDGKPFFVIPAIPAQVPPVRHMRWAAFLRKCPPDEAVRILKDLKLDNDTINRVRTLVSWQDYRLGPDKYSIRTAMSRMEPDLFDDLLDFRMCLAQIESEGNKTCQEQDVYKRQVEWDGFVDTINNKPGFVKAMWCGCQECEDKIKEETGATSRCMPFEQENLSDTCICCKKPAKKMVYWGRAY